MLHLLFRGEREARLDGATLGDPRGHVLAQYGAVFEAVPRAAAHQPDVFKRGMAVDQEVAVRGVLVLADAAFNHGGIFHGGEKMLSVPAGFLQPFEGRDSPAGVGVKRRTVPVNRHLKTSVLKVGHAVSLIVTQVDPRRQRGRLEPWVTRRHAEEEDLLARRKYAVAEQVRKHLGEPRTAGENKDSGVDAVATARRDGGEFPRPLGLTRCRIQILDAAFRSLPDD